MNSGILYIVATPIGNSTDITLRAMETMENVSILACEDTRETRKLFELYAIPQPELVSYHAQSPDRVENGLLDALENGQSVGLVTDRGTPGISDPGQRLVQRAVEHGIQIVPIPGVSALIAALSASGANTHTFWFRGFIPHKKGRQTFIQTTLAHPDTVVFYESPHRILKCLHQCVELGAERRRIIVGRELTKMHEEFLRGTAAELEAALAARPFIKGEFVVIVDAVNNT